jgi:hypothetical protein
MTARQIIPLRILIYSILNVWHICILYMYTTFYAVILCELASTMSSWCVVIKSIRYVYVLRDLTEPDYADGRHVDLHLFIHTEISTSLHNPYHCRSNSQTRIHVTVTVVRVCVGGEAHFMM